MDVSIIVILLLAKIENFWNYSVLFFSASHNVDQQKCSVDESWPKKKKWKKKTESSVMNELTKNLIVEPRYDKRVELRVSGTEVWVNT